MTDIDIDIERLRKDAKELAPPGKCGCLAIPFYHQSCAILALIEQMEKAESQRDALQEQNAALRNGNPLGPLIGAQALALATQQRDWLAKAAENMLMVFNPSAESDAEYAAWMALSDALDKPENETDE